MSRGRAAVPGRALRLRGRTLTLALAAALLSPLVVGAAPAAVPEPIPVSGAAVAALTAPPAPCPPPPGSPTADEVRDGLRTAKDRGFLWRVERDGRTSWLYGTIHVARRDWMLPGPRTLDALRRADALALELDVTDPAVLGQLQQAVLAQAGDPPLAPALRARLDRAVAAGCVGADELRPLRPEMQAMTLVVSAARRAGLEPAYGVDVVLAGLAHGLEKPVRSLEAPADQIAVLVHADPAEAAQNVADLLDEIERPGSAAQLERLANAWQGSRLDELESWPQWCDCLGTERERAAVARLIDDRNVAMAARIERDHGRSGALFAAVGSLHMVGPQGLPALLRARGFRVTRVEFDPAD